MLTGGHFEDMSVGEILRCSCGSQMNANSGRDLLLSSSSSSTHSHPATHIFPNMQDIGHDHTRGRDRSLQGPGTCRRRYRCPHIPDILLPQPVTRSPQKVGLYFIIEPLHLERVEDLISRITPITLPICPTATPNQPAQRPSPPR